MALILIFCATISHAQTVYTSETLPKGLAILKIADEMTGKTSFSVVEGLLSTDIDKKQGFVLRPVIESDFTVDYIYAQMVGIGKCFENDTMIILFEDDTNVTLKSWSKFNCDGIASFRTSSKINNDLTSKRIKKIRLTNGRTFESYTGEIELTYQDYFIRFFKLLEAKETISYKLD